jgi:hypothetical protein
MMTTFYVIDFIYNLNDYAFFIKWLIFKIGELKLQDIENKRTKRAFKSK